MTQPTLWILLPLPDGWERWDGGVVHLATDLTFRGPDQELLTRQAAAADPLLPDLAGWRVSYDPTAEGHSVLHPWTALRDGAPAVSGATIDELALHAHHALMTECDYPDVAFALYDRLFLTGWRWHVDRGLFMRGAESLSPDQPVGALEWAARP